MTVGTLKTVVSFPRKPPLFVWVVSEQEGGRGGKSILNMGFLTTWIEVGGCAFILVACREIVILKF